MISEDEKRRRRNAAIRALGADAYRSGRPRSPIPSAIDAADTFHWLSGYDNEVIKHRNEKAIQPLAVLEEIAQKCSNDVWGRLITEVNQDQHAVVILLLMGRLEKSYMRGQERK